MEAAPGALRDFSLAVEYGHQRVRHDKLAALRRAMDEATVWMGSCEPVARHTAACCPLVITGRIASTELI
jgi:hypothetical protein